MIGKRKWMRALRFVSVILLCTLVTREWTVNNTSPSHRENVFPSQNIFNDHIIRNNSLQHMHGDHGSPRGPKKSGNIKTQPSDKLSRKQIRRCEVSGVHERLVAGEDPAIISACDRILYNRVPKCGSRTILSTIHQLADNLNYTLLDMPKYGRHNYFTRQADLETFVKNVTSFESTFLYSQHVHFVNFTSYGLENPVYINVIRDPVDRMVSEYYYNQFGSSGTHWKQRAGDNAVTFDECVSRRGGACMNVHRILPFFCGHTLECKKRTDWSLARAKQIISRYYLVVGMQEELSDFVLLIEKLLPQHFSGASQIFNKIESESELKFKTTKKREIKEKTRLIMRKHLHHEYDFYYFVQKRFRDLYNAVVTQASGKT